MYLLIFRGTCDEIFFLARPTENQKIKTLKLRIGTEVIAKILKSCLSENLSYKLPKGSPWDPWLQYTENVRQSTYFSP